MSHITRRFGDGEGILGIGAHLLAVLGPTHESIARRGRGLQGAAFALVVGASTSNGAAVGRVSRGRDGVGLGLELRHIACRLRDGEGVVRVGAHLLAVLGPAEEDIACGGRGLQSAAFTLVVGSAARNSAAVGRVGRRRDGVGLDLLLKVGHQSAVGCDVEGVFGVGRNHIVAFFPVGEGVAIVGRGRNGAGSTLVIGAATCDGASVVRIGRHADGILRNTAADVDVLDVGLALRLGDHDAHLSCSNAGRNRHADRSRSRHQSRAFQHIVLRNGHIRAFLSAHLERSGS